MIKKSLVASVNERSSHTTPTPHGGGIALSLTWFIGLVYLYFIGEIEPSLFYALLFGSSHRSWIWYAFYDREVFPK